MGIQIVVLLFISQDTYEPANEISISMGEIFRINTEFRILRLTFYRKSASKCLIKEILIASLISF